LEPRSVSVVLAWRAKTAGDGGRLADMFGRRRLFFIGAAIFACFSVLGGAAQSELWLIVWRALMGIGGAMMWPAVLGMTYDVLPEEKAGLAGGLIIGVSRDRHDHGRPGGASERARPGDGLGLERRAHPRPVRALRLAARGVRGDRAPGGRGGADTTAR
jgi:hypothetical protein